ncbi:anti-sigma factor family protein [Actinomadura rugatobispora]|uniref:Anti-sigma factor family protein n=1 Tax=Actinomadura rugatobispora TaxID=1994 RepID=A0ABW1A4F8_9ACTN|nr:hypothetical protein GCM10010200_062900 [Actinomadura rugatobispora]
MSCLGERLTALVDGELGHEERDRAHAHLAVCERCRSEADSLRKLKGRLRGLGGLPPSDGADDLPSGDFMARLRGLAQPEGGGLPGERGLPGEGSPGDRRRDHDDFPGRRGPDDAPSPAPRTRPQRGLGASSTSARPRDNRPAGRVALAPGGGRGAGAVAVRRGSSRRYLAVGAATLVIGLGAASYAAGGQAEVPTVSPAFDRFAVEHALTSGDVPMTDPVDGATPVPSVPEP